MLKRSLFFLVVFALLVAGGYYGWERLQGMVEVDPPQQVTVNRGLFVHEILDRGSVESARNTDIISRVETGRGGGAGGGGLSILFVIPEGTLVEEGDMLVELDGSALREAIETQMTSVLAAESNLVQAQASLATSRIQLTEYLSGVFEQDRRAIQNRLFSAEELVRTLENDLSYYQRLLERGHITPAQVDAALIELNRAINTREMERLNLSVLETYTRERRVIQLNASIASDEAQVHAAERTLRLRNNHLGLLEEQLSRCRIYAPRSGQVVYFVPRVANDDLLVREGMRVIERQVILQLPDPTQMQVRALVNEANVRLVRPGQRATVRLEAFPNEVFAGVVRTVNDFPEPVTFMGGASAMSREYLTTVTILDPPEGIRVGLTAEVRIVVNEIPDVLLLPMQAVFQHGGKMYAITFNEGKWDKVEVRTGSANDREVVILEGLNEGDEVVLGSWAHRDRVDLPRLEQEQRRGMNGMDEEMLREMMMHQELGQQQRESPAEGSGNAPRGGGPGGGAGGAGAPGGGGGFGGGGGPGGGPRM